MSRLLYIAFDSENECLGAFVTEERAGLAVETANGKEPGLRWSPPLDEEPEDGHWTLVAGEEYAGRVESITLDRRFADRDRRRS